METIVQRNQSGKKVQADCGCFRISDILPPPEISRRWAEIPPDAEDLASHLAPVSAWLGSAARPGDFVLIQGEFGATLLMVNEAIRLGLVPVYSTTICQAVEQHLPDGQVGQYDLPRVRLWHRSFGLQ